MQLLMLKPTTYFDRTLAAGETYEVDHRTGARWVANGIAESLEPDLEDAPAATEAAGEVKEALTPEEPTAPKDEPATGPEDAPAAEESAADAAEPKAEKPKRS